MSQLPRDPRQLARDILSGKVKLEDLAREKARQQQMPGGIAPTARVPSPRMPPPQQRPVQTARPPAFPQRPQTMRVPPPPPQPPRQQPQRQQTQQRPSSSQQRPAPTQQRRTIPPPQQQRQKTESMAVRTERQDRQALEAAAPRASQPRAVPKGGAGVRAMLRDRQSIRTGILLSEILGPPKALRE